MVKWLRARSVMPVLVLLGAAGCAAPPAPLVEHPSGPRSAADWSQVLRTRTDSLRTLQADLELEWSDPATGESESCRGSVSWEASGRLRVRGVSAAFFTVFDLVTDGEDVWLDVPREGFVVFGDRHDPAWSGLPLSPGRVTGALLADPCPGRDCLLGASVREDSAAVHLEWPGGELEIDPATGLPRRWEGDGFEVRWEGWHRRGTRSWPDHTIFRDPDGGELDIRWGRIRVDITLPPGRFVGKIEDSREILTPSDGARRWSRLRPTFRTDD